MAAKSFLFAQVSHCSCGRGTDGWVVFQNRVHLMAQTLSRESTHLPTEGKQQ